MNTPISIIENTFDKAPHKGVVHVTHNKEDYFQSYKELYPKVKLQHLF